MQSLTDLNTYAATAIEVPDPRPARAVFNYTYPKLFELDVVKTIDSTTVSVDPKIDIVEVINYSTANVRYRVEIKNISGSSITFPALPTGVTLSTVGNVYTLSGIRSQADWEVIKSFTWTLPANYATFKNWYLDISVVYRDQATNSDVNVGWEAYDLRYYYIANMKSEFAVSAAGGRPRSASAALNATFIMREYYLEMFGTFRMNVSAVDAVLRSATAMSTVNKRYRSGRSTMNVTATQTAVTRRIIGPIIAPLSTQATLTAERSGTFVPRQGVANLTPTASLNCTPNSAFLGRATIAAQFNINDLIGNAYSVTRLVDDVATTGIYFGEMQGIEFFNGDHIVVGSPNDNSVYVFKRTGTTWSQQTKLSTTVQDISGPYYRQDRGTGGYPSYNFLVSTSTNTQRYRYDGSSWVSAQTYPYVGRAIYNGQWSTFYNDDGTIVSFQNADPNSDGTYEDYAVTLPGTYITTGQYGVAASGTTIAASKIQTASQFRTTLYNTNPISGSNSLALDIVSRNFDYSLGDRVAYGLTRISYMSGQTVISYDLLAVAHWQKQFASSGVIYFHTNGNAQYSYQTLTAPMPAAGDEFGKSIIIRSNLLLIGAPGYNGGAVYMYRPVGDGSWTLEQVFRPDYPATGMRFGETISLSNNEQYITIGAPNIDPTQGSVFVYRLIP